MNLSSWANVALVWLALLCFVSLLIPLVAAYFAVRGMNAVHNKTRALFNTTQSYSRRLRTHSDVLSEQVRAPIVRVRRQEAALEQTLRALLPRSQRLGNQRRGNQKLGNQRLGNQQSGNQQNSTQETNRES